MRENITMWTTLVRHCFKLKEERNLSGMRSWGCNIFCFDASIWPLLRAVTRAHVQWSGKWDGPISVVACDVASCSSFRSFICFKFFLLLFIFSMFQNINIDIDMLMHCLKILCSVKNCWPNFLKMSLALKHVHQEMFTRFENMYMRF